MSPKLNAENRNAIVPPVEVLQRRIRILLWFFIFGLVISGATAIPLETELRFLTQWTGGESGAGQWFVKIRDSLAENNVKYPFIAYGTDWLAFGHSSSRLHSSVHCAIR